MGDHPRNDGSPQAERGTRFFVFVEVQLALFVKKRPLNMPQPGAMDTLPKTTAVLLFAQQYQDALQQHLSSEPRRRPTSRLARSLGRDATDSGLGALDLVRIHVQALSALAAQSSPPIEIDARKLTQCSVFLLEALAPIEAWQQHTLQISDEAHQRCTEQLTQEAQRYSQLLEESKHLQVRAQRMAHQILMAQEEERKEISRELHDEVAQILAGINVRLAALNEVSTINSRSLKQNILQTQKLVEESVDRVHRFARRLRPAMLDDLGLIPALRSYIKELPGRKGLDIRLTAFAEVETLDNIRRTVLYRVAQEALLNVARHAHAHVATVRIQEIRDQVRLEVYDDGKSFHVDRILANENHQRLGLLGMRERVEMVGGKFSIDSGPGRGTTVCAEIPFQPNESVTV